MATKNKGDARRAQARLRKAYGKLAAKIDKEYKIGFTDPEIASYMAVNEFGSRDGHIPERAFFRTALKKSRKKVERTIKSSAKSSRRRVKAMKNGAEVFKEEIQAQILEWSIPPNAPSTVRQKGFNDPLINTGAAYDNVSVERVNKSKTKL